MTLMKTRESLLLMAGQPPNPLKHDVSPIHEVNSVKSVKRNSNQRKSGMYEKLSFADMSAAR